jgi:hypothetical protein
LLAGFCALQLCSHSLLLPHQNCRLAIYEIAHQFFISTYLMLACASESFAGPKLFNAKQLSEEIGIPSSLPCLCSSNHSNEASNKGPTETCMKLVGSSITVSHPEQNACCGAWFAIGYFSLLVRLIWQEQRRPQTIIQTTSRLDELHRNTESCSKPSCAESSKR